MVWDCSQIEATLGHNSSQRLVTAHTRSSPTVFSPPKRSKIPCRPHDGRQRNSRRCASCGAPKSCRCCLEVPDYHREHERLGQQLRKLQRQNRTVHATHPREPLVHRRSTHFFELHEKQKQKLEQAKRENSMMHGTSTSNTRSSQQAPSRPPRPRSAGSQRSTTVGVQSNHVSSMTSSHYSGTWRPRSASSRPQSATPARSDAAAKATIPNSEEILKILRSKRLVSHAHWAEARYNSLDLCSVANAFFRLQRVYRTGSDYAKVQRTRKELGNSALAECVRECLGGHLPDGRHMGRLVEFLLDDEGNDVHSLTKERFEKFTWQLKNFEADLHFEKTVVFALFEPDRCSQEAFDTIEGFFKKEFVRGQILRSGGCTLNDFIRLAAPSAESGILEPDFERLEEVLQKLRRRRHKDHAAWAARAFKKLDLDASGDLSRTELQSSICGELLKDCFDTRLEIDGDSLKLLVDFLLARADADGHSRISREEFEDFTWLVRAVQPGEGSKISQRVDESASGVGFETRLLFSLFTPVKDPLVDVLGLQKVLTRHSATRLKRQRRQIAHGSAHANSAHAFLNEVGVVPDVLGSDVCGKNFEDLDHTRAKSSEKDVVPDEAVIRTKLRERRRREHSRWVDDAFARLDLDRSGKLNRVELGTPSFISIIKECVGHGDYFNGRDSREMRRLVNFAIGKADADGDHNISRQEFEDFTWQLRNLHSDVDFETEFIFAMFDANRDNKIDLQEYERLFNFQSAGGKSVSSKEYIATIMKELDEDNDGNITREEFRAWAKATPTDLDDSFVENPHEGILPSTDQAGHKTWAAEAYGILDSNQSGTITRSQLETDVFMTMVQEMQPGRNLKLDNIMCLVDLALKRDYRDGDYRIKRDEFELLMWKLRMMHIDKRAGRQISTPVPPQQWLSSERRRIHKSGQPARLNLQGLDQEQSSRSLAREFSSTQKADLYNKLVNRRRKEHSLWSAKKFRQLDIDGNGGLSRLELGTAFFAECIRECLGEAQHLPELTYMKSLVNFVLGRADADGDHHLSLREFEDFTWQVKNMQSDIDFETEFVFSLFDPDRNGQLDLEEFERLFNFQSRGGSKVSSKQYIKDVMAELDADGDGSISLSEYRTWQRSLSGSGTMSVKDVELLDPEVRRREHRDWALIKFACVDYAARGYVTRSELCNEWFLDMLQEILPKRALEVNIIMPLVDFLLGQHNTDDYHISPDEFEVLLWKIQKLDMKTWRQTSDENDLASETGDMRSTSSSVRYEESFEEE